ncbi:MAG: tetratricopeptide (TPR) repeat protein [Bacteroidia bacterium]|jgi:tetratricopeptide (TPR) repeat protein
MNEAPSNEQAWLACMETGKQGFKGGRFEDAVNAFARATELAPERVEGWINLGSTLIEFGDHNTAAKVLEQAISLNPDIMISHMILGDATRMLAQPDRALACYEKAASMARAPEVLNRLACMYRSVKRPEEAEALFAEVLEKDPGFTLAKVNRAGLQIELGNFDKAQQQLDALLGVKLAPVEEKEVKSTRTALAEYHRLHEAIDDLALRDNQGALEQAIRDTPTDRLGVDNDALKTLDAYVSRAGQLAPPSTPAVTDLPPDWALIEALFMIPMVDSVDEYRALKAQISGNASPSNDLLQSLNMEAVIHAIRASKDDLFNPARMELQLRRWHALACRGLDGFMPGHYKYNQNWTSRNPTLVRVNPGMVSGTLRHALTVMYPKVPAGLPRAAFVYLLLADLHPFADGNARLGMAWMNRELEWAGEMPALITNARGIKTGFGNAGQAVRENGGDLTPLISVISRAQDFTQQFCSDLNV